MSKKTELSAYKNSLSLEAARKLHENYQNTVKKEVRKAVPVGCEDEKALLAAAEELLFLSSRRRAKIKHQDLKGIVSGGLKRVGAELRKVREILDPFDKGRVRNIFRVARIFTAAARRKDTPEVLEAFGDDGRIYVDLYGDEESETKRQVSSYLKEKGYVIVDYKKGYATDKKGKQQFRIGKLVKGNEALLSDFKADPVRTMENTMLVISRNSDDIVRMSTNRGWTSCMSYNGIYFDRVPRDIKSGTLVAYLISKNDPEINDPLARILLKPFSNKQGQCIYVADKAYGCSNAVFATEVEGFAEHLNQGKSGSFSLKKGLYRDDIQGQKLRFDKDASALDILDILNVNYALADDGKVTVIGDLNLSGLYLKKLPPSFADIVVEGDFNCSNNDLSSLENAPQEVGGSFNCSSNSITSLEHRPQRVGGDFECQNNELSSLEHSPQKVNGSFNCRGNQLQSLEHAPQSVESVFNCSNNALDSLEHAPQKVDGSFYCNSNSLQSLEYAPQNVIGKFDCRGNKLRSLEFSPQKVSGEFDCSANMLISLKHAPQEIGQGFICSNNKITNLEHRPQTVGGDFNCSGNKLASLEHAPEIVEGSFNCKNNPLASLQYAPRDVKKDFNCYSCNLASLEYAPRNVGGEFKCGDNNLTSLEHTPQHIGGSFDCYGNALISLKGAPKQIVGDFNCNNNSLVSLKHAPQNVGGAFCVGYNELTSLEHGPLSVGGAYYCNRNKLTSLKHAPQKVGQTFDCVENDLDSLAGIPTNFSYARTDFGYYYKYSKIPRKYRKENASSSKNKELKPMHPSL